MTNNIDFYKWFEEITPKLGDRKVSFKKIFKYLDGWSPSLVSSYNKKHGF